MGGRDDSMFQGEAQGLQAMYGKRYIVIGYNKITTRWSATATFSSILAAHMQGLL